MGPRWALLLLSVAAVAAAHVAPARGHSSITQPSPNSAHGNCKVGKGIDGYYHYCPGPCPNARIKDVTPVTSTTRGADFPVRWFKNNHLGGFVRWTLVPVHLAQSHEAHDEGAFEWGCFSAGHLKCTPADKEEHCGGDLTGSAFHATVRVPTNIADGEYMLGWSWFGGYALQPPTVFSDYYDCARVRIKGGAPLTEFHQPAFRPGGSTNVKTRLPDKCIATVDALGVCSVSPCNVTLAQNHLKPRGFSGGATPPRIPASFFTAVANPGSTPPPLAVHPAPPMSPSAGPPPLNELFTKGPPTPGPVTLPAIYVIDVQERHAIRWLPPSPALMRMRKRAQGVLIEADARGSVDTVHFSLDGKWVADDKVYPYTLGSEVKGSGLLRAWAAAPVGRSFTLHVTVVGRGGLKVKGMWWLQFV